MKQWNRACADRWIY